MIRTPGVVSGNAADDPNHRGWFVGHFIPDRPDDTRDRRRTEAVEVKWAVYAGGEVRAGWGANRAGTTLAILVRGRFQLRFPDREVILEREGDFAMWEPGVPHHWRADGPTIIFSVRWPSRPGDSVLVPAPSGAEP